MNENEVTYTIDLGNGKVLENLTLNGNNYVSDIELHESDFSGMSNVTITDSNNNSVILKHAKLQQVMPLFGKWYFILEEMSNFELQTMANSAQLFYTAAMTDTLIEGEE